MATVSDERLGQVWSLVEETTETLFELPVVRVRGTTRLYEDHELREAIAEAAPKLDRPWRFFFVSELAFEPPLAPGIGPAMVRPMVTSEARREFAENLRERGFEGIERERGRRFRFENGLGTRLMNYTGTYPIRTTSGERHDVAIEGSLAVWYAGSFRIAGGAYPTDGFEELLSTIGVGGIETGEPAYHEELLELLAGVE